MYQPPALDKKGNIQIKLLNYKLLVVPDIVDVCMNITAL